jgi:RNA recognition motif-containing protein
MLPLRGSCPGNVSELVVLLGRGCVSPPLSPLLKTMSTEVKEVAVGTKLYVGSLPYSTTEQQLSELFSQYGTVTSAKVITDRYTGQSRGFGFVEMSTGEEAQKAIAALNGSALGGRTLVVNEARPQEKRPYGGGGGGGGGDQRDRW